jgi:class 3 adenylate cyclase/HAMP domain-containing protein
MRLGNKVLTVTLSVTLSLSGSVVWVVSHNVTARETRRAQDDIQSAVAQYFDQIDSLHRERISAFVRLLMEGPQYRALLEQIEFGDDRQKTFAIAQLREEVFGRMVQQEVQVHQIAPAFHVLINDRGDVLLTSAGDDDALASKLAGDSASWPWERVLKGEHLARKYAWVQGRLFLAFGVPLRMYMGEPPTHAYFLGFEVNDTWVQRLLGLSRRVHGAALDALFLVDGEIVASSVSGMIATRATALKRGVTAAADETKLQNQPDDIVFRANRERFLGRALLFTPADDSTGLFAVVSSLDRALDALRSIQKTILAVTLAFAVIAVFVCRQLAKIIAHPVNDLVSGTERIARGEFNVPIDVDRKDEFGRLAVSFNQMAAGLAQRDVIKDTFGKFVDPKVVDAFLEDPSTLHLGGERRVQSVLFSDLANFTALTERLDPEQLIQLLNQYLGSAADTVSHTRGIVDKFIGDAVVAFWGPPLTDANAALACESALRIVRDTDELFETVPQFKDLSLRVRVGITTGEVIVGNIGSPSKFNYTVMGDTVNLASRLEGVNKVYGTQILVDARTSTEAAAAVVTRKIDTVRVVGRSEPVELFEVLAMRPDAEQWRDRCEAYANALARYRNGDWSAAQSAFADILDDDPTDNPAKTLADRCAAFVEQPPDADWDGVFDLDSK